MATIVVRGETRMSNEPKRGPVFSSKMAMILTCMGMAVGTGNIWRFPREVAKNDGGSFLIPWIIFLVLWSVPLLMVELSTGQNTRRGPFGAFAKLVGKNFSWKGGFISICAMIIMCYYAVFTGWTLRYVIYAVQGTFEGMNDAQAIALFDNLRGTPTSLLFHLLAVGFAVGVVYTGAKGIERFNKVLIPMLILILVIGAIKSLQLMFATPSEPGVPTGLSYLFSFDAERLMDPAHWIAGLTQSAWSTGAGWGLMLAYAVYARDREDPVTTPMATGAGNNSIEMLVALLIFPALFALMGIGAVDYVSCASWKGGIAFQVIPMLFNQMSYSYIFNLLFFVGLASAALTSLVAMVELSSRFFVDFQISRKTALAITGGMCVVIGSPSALSDSFFDNQDFVWGVGLILSGMFLAFMVLRVGVKRFRSDFLNKNATLIKVGPWFGAAMILVLIEGVVLLGWWLIQGANTQLALWCFGQWGVVIALLLIFEKKLIARMETRAEDNA
jgi:NSS family neurotransmitter:Na+ symporter